MNYHKIFFTVIHDAWFEGVGWISSLLLKQHLACLYKRVNQSINPKNAITQWFLRVPTFSKKKMWNLGQIISRYFTIEHRKLNILNITLLTNNYHFPLQIPRSGQCNGLDSNCLDARHIIITWTRVLVKLFSKMKCQRHIILRKPECSLIVSCIKT